MSSRMADQLVALKHVDVLMEGIRVGTLARMRSGTADAYTGE